MPNLQPDALIATAIDQTGLDDFGSDSYREGLDVYCESVSVDAQLNDIGAAAIPGAGVSALANRLRVIDWAKRHPEIADERIDEHDLLRRGGKDDRRQRRRADGRWFSRWRRCGRAGCKRDDHRQDQCMSIMHSGTWVVAGIGAKFRR
jgi:hypothetical protein